MITIVIAAKYLPATDTRGSRFKITNMSSGVSATVAYDYAAGSPTAAAVRKAGVVAGDYTLHHGGTHANVEYYTAILER